MNDENISSANSNLKRWYVHTCNIVRSLGSQFLKGRAIRGTVWYVYMRVIPSDLNIFFRLFSFLILLRAAIFRETTSTNVALEAKVDELERELSVWKSAFKNAEEEKKALNKSVVSLERRIDSLKVRRFPFVCCRAVSINHLVRH